MRDIFKALGDSIAAAFKAAYAAVRKFLSEKLGS